MAPAPFKLPAPWVSTFSSETGSALNSRNALTAFGVSRVSNRLLCASSIRATTPVVTAVAMLVPLNSKYVA